VSPRIELRAFMGLSELFRKRNWSNPLELDIEREMTGVQLLAVLDIRLEKVEVFFVSGKGFQSGCGGSDRRRSCGPGAAGGGPVRTERCSASRS